MWNRQPTTVAQETQQDGKYGPYAQPKSSPNNYSGASGGTNGQGLLKGIMSTFGIG
jgi:hypothetical protein